MLVIDVITAVTPKGVEHSRSQSLGFSGICVITAVTPKGVEHCKGTSMRLNDDSGDNRSDAERR